MQQPGSGQRAAGVGIWDNGLSEILKALDASQTLPVRLKDHKHVPHQPAAVYYVGGGANYWSGQVVVSHPREGQNANSPATSLYYNASASPFNAALVNRTPQSLHKHYLKQPAATKVWKKSSFIAANDILVGPWGGAWFSMVLSRLFSMFGCWLGLLFRVIILLLLLLVVVVVVLLLRYNTLFIFFYTFDL